ncbi:PREDICTED: 26.5 kDa heat shock protein, mitochondrial-like [Fragaria vesca subsp. vesca]|uniref:26.5 kDa heat shock protein, mitochondrial-like n=1 Tax=Fragaria vesca subsp. vesca TaxID=101020 RepID=UPI0002C33C1A|nr:PREDICTED: 26.5 kDa heat shock protein, mitochondrial-like [Fragaria vesca subsp. vesca]
MSPSPGTTSSGFPSRKPSPTTLPISEGTLIGSKPTTVESLERALMQATGNINRLFQNLSLSPWLVSGRVKEQDDCYKLQFDMPGLTKEDVKISVHHGNLTIKGEHKAEEGEETDDEFWSSRSYGYYNTSLALPDDAKVDEIKASLKDGVLSVTIPRSEKPKEDVKEVNIN